MFKTYKEYKENRKPIIFKPLEIINNDVPSNIAIIIPYRNRLQHLTDFKSHIKSLSIQKHKVDIFVIEQNNGDKFNRGLLLNLGYLIAKQICEYDRYIFHDVDSYPNQDIYDMYFTNLDKTIHYASPELGYKYTFPNFLGGVIGLPKSDFEKVNGFPNNFFGWGGEDDALYNRLSYNNIIVHRPIRGSFTLPEHDSPTQFEYNNAKKKNIIDDLKYWKGNGIRQLPRFFIKIKKYDTFENFIIFDSNVTNDSDNLETFLSKKQKKINENVAFYYFKIDYLSIHNNIFDKLLDKNYGNEKVKERLEKLKNEQYFQHKTNPIYISSIEPLITLEEVEAKIFDTFTVPKKFKSKLKESKVGNLVQKYFAKYDKKLSKEDLFNTIKFIFNTFNELIYFRIRDNKITCAYHLYNPKNTVDWLKYLKYKSSDGNEKNLDESLVEIITENAKNYYTLRKPHFIPANNCLLGLEAFNYYEGNAFSYVKQFKEMLEVTIKTFQNVPDCDILINRKDFAYFNVNKTFAYNHLMKNEKMDIDKLWFLGSQSCKNENLDIPIPSGDEWKDIDKANNYEVVEWEDRIPIAIFRGASTGCGSDVTNNPRMKLAQISYDWPREKRIDVAISTLVSRIRVYNQFIGITNQNKYKHLIGNFINPNDQLKYKYVFNIEGNAQAYRFGNEFKKGAVILNVKSEFHCWFEPLLKEKKHLVTISSDYSDLESVLNYLKENDKEAKLIASNGLKFARKYIDKKMISLFWFHYMLNINKVDL